jgi:hypothetical protein
MPTKTMLIINARASAIFIPTSFIPLEKTADFNQR